jgi:predicted membrane protein
MFRAVLFTQWKWNRLALLPAVLLAFGLPLLSVQDTALVREGRFTAAGLLESLGRFAPLFPLLAGFIALLLAVGIWRADHQGRHVYALTLPLARWRFVLLRLGAGLVLLAVPLSAFWAGARLAAWSATVPPGLHAYPDLLALRFGLAALVAFGFFFAISAGSTRTAGWILALLAAWILAQIILHGVGSRTDIVSPVLDDFFAWPGPFDIFTGRWMLIDV